MSNILVSYHPSRKRLEIQFPDKPDARVRYRMKDVEFHWDGTAAVWHLAMPVSLKFVRSEPVRVDGWALALHTAAEIAGLTPAHTEALTRLRDDLGDNSSHEDRECGDRAYEDRCAQVCGL